MCSELDPWTNGSQLSQLDLKSTRAFPPYVCLKLPLSCEHCYFPKLASFHVGSPRELIPLWSSQIKKENSSQVSVWWGSLTMVVKLMWTRLYMPVVPFQSPGWKENLTSFEFKHFFSKLFKTTWYHLIIFINYILLLSTYSKMSPLFCLLAVHRIKFCLFKIDQSFLKIFRMPQSSWRCWKSDTIRYSVPPSSLGN